MTKAEITTRLGNCGMPIFEDSATPANGAARPLPYMVVHTDDTIDGDDMGVISINSTQWRVSLCTATKSVDMEQKVRRELAEAVQMTVTRQQFDNYHQTDWEFTTRNVVKGVI